MNAKRSQQCCWKVIHSNTAESEHLHATAAPWNLASPLCHDAVAECSARIIERPVTSHARAHAPPPASPHHRIASHSPQPSPLATHSSAASLKRHSSIRLQKIGSTDAFRHSRHAPKTRRKRRKVTIIRFEFEGLPSQRAPFFSLFLHIAQSAIIAWLPCMQSWPKKLLVAPATTLAFSVGLGFRGQLVAPP